MSSFSDELNRDILERVEAIESPDYKYPPRIKKADYIGFALLAVVCLAGSVAVILYGANL